MEKWRTETHINYYYICPENENLFQFLHFEYITYNKKKSSFDKSTKPLVINAINMILIVCNISLNWSNLII